MGSKFSCPGSDQAGASAAANAFLGAFGLSDLSSVTGSDGNSAQDKLNDANAALTKLEAAWQEKIASEKTEITEDQISYIQNLLDFSNVETSLLTEKLYEQNGRNTLLIGMLICLVIFLILFDIL